MNSRIKNNRDAWRKGCNQPSPDILALLERFMLGSRVLDYGCGYGNYSLFLANKGYQVTAYDIERNFHSKVIRFVKAKGNRLPFNDNHFDVTLLIHVLEHIEDDVTALREMRRVTKRRLIFAGPNADDEKLHPYNLTYKHHIDKGHYREYTTSDFGELLTRNGFEVIFLDEKGPIDPFVFQEFIDNKIIARCLVLALKMLRKFKLMKRNRLCSDIFAVADVRK